MEKRKDAFAMRWLYLAAGVTVLLFAGVLYSWSILKTPLADTFGWSASALALNFTLTMCFFCLGGMLGGLLSRQLGGRAALRIAAAMACMGFLAAAGMSGKSVAALYLSYGFLASIGIGVAYNVVVTDVSAWFPDKRGLCSGALMMGFGASTLIVGNVAGTLLASPAVGWRKTYALLGICLGAVLLLVSLFLHGPAPEIQFPQAEVKKGGVEASERGLECAPREMLRRGSFWRTFLCVVFLAAVGNTVISFAKDLSVSVGAGEQLATALVGVLSVCNGLGRIATGLLYDRLGRRWTMLAANASAILASAVTLAAVCTRRLPLCVAGLCVTGMSYGACPTISSAFISSFYGAKHFSVNFSIMNFNLMGASFIASAANVLLASTGSYAAPFTLLLILSVAALFLNLSVKRP